MMEDSTKETNNVLFDALTRGDVSIWDFILFDQTQEAETYIGMLQSKDDSSTEGKEMLTARVLDARVEASVRFNFINPLVGQHGYLHIRYAQSTNSYASYVLLKGSTPLHYAVQLQHHKLLKILLESGCDLSALDEKNQTAYRMARINNDEGSVAVFQQHRNFGYQLRKQARLNEHINNSYMQLQGAFSHAQEVVQNLERVRQNLMAQLVCFFSP